MTRLREPLSRPWSLVLLPLAVLVTVAVVALVSWGMYEAFQEEDEPVVRTTPAASPAAIDAGEVDVAFETALDEGVMAGDRSRWKGALPAEGAATAALASIWKRLAPLEWGELDAEVTPIPGKPGVFEIEITGTPGGAGPDDRILVDRVLEFARGSTTMSGDGGTTADGGSGGGLVAVGDRTPAATKRQFLMAYKLPQMVRADGVVVIYDDGRVGQANDVAWLVPAARQRVAEVLDERSDKPIVAFVYSSRKQLVDYLGDPSIDQRVAFFSRMPTTLSRHAWSPADIGVVAAAANPLGYQGEELQAVVTHETTHAVTWRLFFDTEHDPMLLSEGLAVATADNRSYLPLRNDLSDGELALPLLDALAVSSLWQGNDIDRVTLAYLMGGSLVKYILAGWGVAELKAFCRGVADSDLTPAAIKAVVRDELGVTWAEFFEGWVAYVNTLP